MYELGPIDRRIWLWGTLAGLLSCVLYPLSYPPMCRLAREAGASHVVRDFLDEVPYRPVRLLIEHTPLREGMFLWGRVWGVENTLRRRRGSGPNAFFSIPQGNIPFPEEEPQSLGEDRGC